MADFRNIHTHIWKDAWFCELQPDEKLLFIYLFSNERASVCGMYEYGPSVALAAMAAAPFKLVASPDGREWSRMVGN